MSFTIITYNLLYFFYNCTLAFFGGAVDCGLKITIYIMLLGCLGASAFYAFESYQALSYSSAESIMDVFLAVLFNLSSFFYILFFFIFVCCTGY